MSSSRNFWGSVFILIGILWMLSLLNIDFHPIRLIAPIWFVVLILAGMAYVAKVRWLGTLLLIIALVAGIASIADSGIADESDHRQIHQEMSVNSSVESVELNIEFGAGELQMRSDEGMNEGVVFSNSISTFSQTDPVLVKRLKDNLMILDVKREATDKGFINPGSEDWDIGLGSGMEYDINLNYGAADAKLDFRNINLGILSIETGASSTSLYLPDESIDADIDMGAADMQIYLPEGRPVRIDMESGMVTKDFNGFVKLDKNTYVTESFNVSGNSSEMIQIDINAGVASISARYY